MPELKKNELKQEQTLTNNTSMEIEKMGMCVSLKDQNDIFLKIKHSKKASRVYCEETLQGICMRQHITFFDGTHQGCIK